MLTRPIAVDLDGTLTRSDTLIENWLRAVKARPSVVMLSLFWLMKGRSYLKAKLAEAHDIEVATLPYSESLLTWLREQKREGVELILATAANEKIAGAVAAHLGIFDRVIASTEDENLKAEVKAQRLSAAVGEGGFIYVGDSRADFPVWQAAFTAHAANPSQRVEREFAQLENAGRIFIDPKAKSSLRTFIRAIRVHQWAKNLLIFVPLLAAHKIGEFAFVIDAILAIAAFSAIASSVYVLNDLLDLEEDRKHKTKRFRPFASGDLRLQNGLILVPILLGFGFSLAFVFLPAPFVLLLLFYLIITFGYSLWLKRLVLIDILTLAMLYVLRVLGGVAALDLQVTFWMLAFCIFLFSSLAMSKRYTEIQMMEATQAKMHGRGYLPQDASLLENMGSSLGLMSVLVLALYINEADNYSQPELLWLTIPIFLFWISRVWLLAKRGEMHEDPVVFALKDNASRCSGAAFGAMFLLAI